MAGTDEDFPHVAATVDSLVRVKAIRPVIVVGIPNTERRRDLTGPTRIKSDSAIAPRVGGSAKFRAFIKDELFAEVSRRYRVTDERSIIGESLAGLFIIETFLLDASMFTNYVALDASLWWNGGSLVEGASARIAQLDGKRRSIYFGVSDIKEMGEGITRLDAMLRKASPDNLRMSYLERLDLTHATIFRALEGPALAFALK
jgi:predicted alpha/beta superfamily hydrolase